MHGGELISLINTTASIKSRQRKALRSIAYRYKLIIIPHQPVSCVEKEKKRDNSTFYCTRVEKKWS